MSLTASRCELREELVGLGFGLPLRKFPHGFLGQASWRGVERLVERLDAFLGSLLGQPRVDRAEKLLEGQPQEASAAACVRVVPRDPDPVRRGDVDESLDGPVGKDVTMVRTC